MKIILFCIPACGVAPQSVYLYHNYASHVSGDVTTELTSEIVIKAQNWGYSCADIKCSAGGNGLSLIKINAIFFSTLNVAIGDSNTTAPWQNNTPI